MGGRLRRILTRITLAAALLALPARLANAAEEFQATASLTVRVVGTPPPGVKAGSSVSYQVLVTNSGSSPLSSVQITQRAMNLALGAVYCSCSVTKTSSAATATARDVGVGQTIELEVTAQVIDAGLFHADVSAVAPGYSMSPPQHNTGVFRGQAQAAAQTPTVNLAPIVWALLHPPQPKPQPPSQPDLPPKSNGQQPTKPPVEPNVPQPPIPTPKPGPQHPPPTTPKLVSKPKLQSALQSKPPHHHVSLREPDLRLTVSLDPSAPYRKGQTVSIAVIVTNKGGAAASNVRLDNVLSGLRIDDVDGDCQALSCQWASLKPGASASLMLTAEVENTERGFSDSVSTTGDDLDTSTTTVGAPGVTPAWVYVAAAAVGAVGAVALGWLAAKAIQIQRRARWRRTTAVTASLDPAAEVSHGPLNPSGPTIAVTARLEPGGAGPRGPVSVTRISRS